MSLLPTPTDHLLPLLILPTWWWWYCDLAHSIKLRLSKVSGKTTTASPLVGIYYVWFTTATFVLGGCCMAV